MKQISWIIIFIVSCSNNIKTENVNCPKINPLETTQQINDITNYIDTVEVISTCNNNIYLNVESSKKIMILDNSDLILFLENKILRIDSSGQLIQSYGNFGRGNGEYLKIYDICLNLNKTEIWALDYINQVFRYDLRSGEFLGTIKLNTNKTNIMDTNGIIPSVDNGLYLVSVNEVNARKINYNYPYLSTFNKNGEFTKTLLQWKDYNIDYPYSPYVSYSLGNYIIRPQENDNICYIVNDGKLSPFLHLHFGDKNIKPLLAFKKGNDPLQSMVDITNTNAYKHIMNIQLTNKYIYFAAIGPHYTQENFLINKENLSGIHWTHKPKDIIPFFILGSDNSYLYGVYTYSENHKNVSAADSPIINYLNRNIMFNEDNDSVILKIKFK